MAASGMDNFIGRTRQTVFKDYDENKLTFRATTRPYKSKTTFLWTVVNSLPTPAPTVAYAKLLKGQTNDFFGFGLQTPLQFTQTFNKPATEADTNLSTARNTNGQEDFVIESISASSSGCRPEYTATDTLLVALGLTDPDVVAAYLGQRYIIDPGTLIAPPQCTSPFNLEDAMFEGFKSVA